MIELLRHLVEAGAIREGELAFVLENDVAATRRWTWIIGGGVTAFDFDEACRHFRFMDVTISLSTLLRMPRADRHRRAEQILTAYAAEQPLCAIILEHDRTTDALYAVGTLGGEMFNAFFDKFEFKLNLDYGSAVRRRVFGETLVTTLRSFCKQQVRC